MPVSRVLRGPTSARMCPSSPRAECASLISITNNPSLYDPYISMERNRKRQLIVLSEMHKQGYLTEEEYQAAVDQDMVFTSVSLSDELFTCTNCEFQGNRDSFEYVREDNVYQCPILRHGGGHPRGREQQCVFLFYGYDHSGCVRRFGAGRPATRRQSV